MMSEEVLSEDRINNYLNTETDTLTKREGVIALREILSLRARVEELESHIETQGHNCRLYSHRATTAEERVKELVEAVTKLTNELSGFVGVYGSEIREVAGNTNVNVLIHWNDNAKSILSKIESEGGAG